VPRSELIAKAREIAEEVATKSPFAIRLAKQSLNVIEELSLRDGYRYEQNMTAQLSGHPDSKEAMAAFHEKRKPKFSS
jgi:enoyl-CoA hydratase